MGLSFIPDDDSRAVSPVIGVIIMLAITVILGAVIATFALDFGDDLDSSAPTTSFQYDLDVQDGNLTVTVQEGDPVDVDSVRVAREDPDNTNAVLSSASGLADEPFLSNLNGGTSDSPLVDSVSDEVDIGQSFTFRLNNVTFTGDEEIDFIFDGGGGGEQRTVLDTYEFIEFDNN